MNAKELQAYLGNEYSVWTQFFTDGENGMSVRKRFSMRRQVGEIRKAVIIHPPITDEKITAIKAILG